MRLRVVTKAGYRYSAPAAASCIETRLLVAATPRQRVQSTALECDPSGWKLSFTDYWGTPTVTVHLHEPHTALALVGTSVVDVEASEAPHTPLTWNELASDKVVDSFAEFLDEMSGMAGEVAVAVVDAGRRKQGGASPAEVARHLASLPGMDADVLVPGLRRVGVPARFARGVRFDADALAFGDSVDAEPSTWVEFFDGVWQGIDPAAGGPTGPGHIAMAYGRVRADLRPLRGIYSGLGRSECYQNVTVKRLG